MPVEPYCQLYATFPGLIKARKKPLSKVYLCLMTFVDPIFHRCELTRPFDRLKAS